MSKKNLKSKDSSSSGEDTRPEKSEKETSVKTTSSLQLKSPSKSPVASKIDSYFSSPSPSSKQTSDVSKSNVKSSDLPKSDNNVESPEVQSKETTQKTSGLQQLLKSPKQGSNSQHGEKKTSAKAKKKSKKKEETSKQSAITEHFVVRRSQRKSKSTIEEEKRKSIESAILEGKEDGLEVRDVEGKGRGVFALKTFERSDLVCEYAGDLIDFKTAKEREKKYSENKDIGCYMYYFLFGNKKYCVDATLESGRVGRLLNHSINGNCTTKVISLQDNPCLILVAAKNIKPDEELLYDYGERDKEAIASYPWLQL